MALQVLISVKSLEVAHGVLEAMPLAYLTCEMTVIKTSIFREMLSGDLVAHRVLGNSCQRTHEDLPECLFRPFCIGKGPAARDGAI